LQFIKTPNSRLFHITKIYISKYNVEKSKDKITIIGKLKVKYPMVKHGFMLHSPLKKTLDIFDVHIIPFENQELSIDKIFTNGFSSLVIV
jgi:hypothetical protein